MKKFLYVVPLLLLILCATPFAIYKESVTPGDSLDSASPSHWIILNLNLMSSGELDISLSEQARTDPKPLVYSENATYKGFPFGAYFSRSESTANSSFNVEGFSWLWTGVDLVLIISTLVLAIKLNRKKQI